MITDAGSGYSRWHDLAVTRWREDATCDADGAYVFLRDMIAGDADKYREDAVFERTATLTRVRAHVHLHALGIGVDEAQLFQRLASATLYSDRTLRASEDTLTRQAEGDRRCCGVMAFLEIAQSCCL